MTIRTYSTDELISMILGTDKSEKLHHASLTELFFAEEGDACYRPELAAARELVKRFLAEELARSNALTSPALVADYLKVQLRGLEHEVFIALFLNTQQQLIATEELSRGTLAQASVYPREVVKRSLHYNAASVIFAHNHPSGIAEPSRADEALTGKLKDALLLVDVKVLDHFVVAGEATVSFAERGIL